MALYLCIIKILYMGSLCQRSHYLTESDHQLRWSISHHPVDHIKEDGFRHSLKIICIRVGAHQLKVLSLAAFGLYLLTEKEVKPMTRIIPLMTLTHSGLTSVVN